MKLNRPNRAFLRSKKARFSPSQPTRFSKLIQKISFIRSLALFLGVFLYFANPAIVVADFLTVTVSSNVTRQTPFEVNLQISAKASTTYFVKARIGNQTNQLNQGQTLSEKDIWLSDTVSWTSFPKFTTDENGMWTGKINAQTTSTVSIGENFLVVRIRDEAASLTDSAVYTINVAEEVVSKPDASTTPQTEPAGEPIINEFVAQPSQGTEWVEIKNKGAGKVDLSGWLIDDEPGKSTPFTIPTGTIIPAGGFFVAQFASAKLNDLTDQVRLLKPDQTEVESYHYSHTEKGSSWSKDKTGGWFLTTAITPGAENAENPLLNPTPTPTVKAATKNSNSTETSSTNQEKETPEKPGSNLLTSNATNTSTVAANFVQKGKGGPTFFSTPLFILGVICLALAAVVLVKKHFREKLVPKSSVVYSSVKMEK